MSLGEAGFEALGGTATGLENGDGGTGTSLPTSITMTSLGLFTGSRSNNHRRGSSSSSTTATSEDNMSASLSVDGTGVLEIEEQKKENDGEDDRHAGPKLSDLPKMSTEGLMDLCEELGIQCEDEDRELMITLLRYKGYGSQGKKLAIAQLRRWVGNVDKVLQEVGVPGISMMGILDAKFNSLKRARDQTRRAPPAKRRNTATPLLGLFDPTSFQNSMVSTPFNMTPPITNITAAVATTTATTTTTSTTNSATSSPSSEIKPYFNLL